MAEGAAGTTGTAATTPAPGMSREEIERIVADALGSSQSTEKTQKILSDNFEYREKLRAANAEIEALKKQVPADGSLVLTAEQKAEWDAFQATGKKAADIVKALKEGEANATKLGGYERREQLVAVAEAEGFGAKDAATVLSTIVGGREIVFETVEETDPEDESKKISVKRAFFKTENADKTVTKKRVSEVIRDEHKAFLPALTAAGEEDEGEAAATKSGTPSGTPYTRQAPVGGKAPGKTGSKNLAKSYISNAYAQPKQS